MKIDPEVLEQFKKARDVFLAARRRHGNYDHGYEVGFSNRSSDTIPDVHIYYSGVVGDDEEGLIYSIRRMWMDAAEEAHVFTQFHYRTLVHFWDEETVKRRLASSKIVVGKEDKVLEDEEKVFLKEYGPTEQLEKGLRNIGEPGEVATEGERLHEESNACKEVPLRNCWSFTDESGYLTKQKLKALGVPEGFVSQNEAYGYIAENLRTYRDKYEVNMNLLFNAITKPRERGEDELKDDYYKYCQAWVRMQLRRAFAQAEAYCERQALIDRNKHINEVVACCFQKLGPQMKAWDLTGKLKITYEYDNDLDLQTVVDVVFE
jgi:hypothetical protein